MKVLEFKEASERLEFVTQPEAARRFGVTDRTIRNWVKHCKLLHGWDEDTWDDLKQKAKALREDAPADGDDIEGALIEF